MKSIRTKITLAAVIAVTVLMIASTVTGVLTANHIGNSDADQTLLLLCETGGKNLDAYFKSVEQSVKMVSAYVESDLEGLEPGQLSAHLDRAKSIFSKMANAASAVLTYYYRIDPAVSAKAKGFWFVNLDGNGFREHEVTDISQYDTEDTAHLVWFTVPKATGKGVWLPPYITDNLDVRVISYNEPIYYGGQFIGVIGIEIDYTTMAEQVNRISVYDSGYAFLADAGGNITYHPRFDVTTMGTPSKISESLRTGSVFISYTYNGAEKRAAWLTLENGMRLVVTAPVKEIHAAWQKWVYQFLTVSFVLLVVIVLLLAYTIHVLHRQEETEDRNANLEKQLQSALELTEMMGSMSSLLSNMPAMSFSKDAATGAYLAGNQAFVDSTGKKELKDIIGLTDWDLYDPVTAKQFIEKDKAALAMDEAYVYYEDVPAPGTPGIRSLQTTKKKFRDASGRLCILGMCVDVTKTTRAKAEEAVIQARRQNEIEKHALEADLERMSYQAFHDELTGVYNRSGYELLLSELDLFSAYILMVDADDFKTINDTYGHEIGDRVLIKIANVLKKYFRVEDRICRIGGDEFVIFMVNAKREYRGLIAAKVAMINSDLKKTEDGVPAISVSVGITYGSEADEASKLLELADRAMYELKRNGKQGCMFSDETPSL